MIPCPWGHLHQVAVYTSANLRSSISIVVQSIWGFSVRLLIVCWNPSSLFNTAVLAKRTPRNDTWPSSLSDPFRQVLFHWPLRFLRDTALERLLPCGQSGHLAWRRWKMASEPLVLRGPEVSRRVANRFVLQGRGPICGIATNRYYSVKRSEQLHFVDRLSHWRPLGHYYQ